MNKQQLNSLYDICSYTRAAGGEGERLMIAKHIEPVIDYKDDYGNYYKRVGAAPVIWSSHTDTVHDLTDSIKQTVHIDDTCSRLSKGKDNMCLGADCGTGVWLMLQMIQAEVQGLYIFHREEEIGGQGSTWIVDNPQASTRPGIHIDCGHWLDEYNQCIAFDRYGTTSIITHQGKQRTCSDGYAHDLAAVLDMNYGLDEGGSFTDSKSYCRTVSECTNISIGYYNQHRNGEYQDLNHLLKLADALCSRGDQIGKLSPYRDPSKVEMLECNNKRSYEAQPPVESYREPGSLVHAITSYPDIVAEMLRDSNPYHIDDEELACLIMDRSYDTQHYN